MRRAEHGLGEAIKLASNESPFGPLPGVADAVAAVDRDDQPLRRPHARRRSPSAFADHVGVDRDRVAVGAGSVGLLEQLALVVRRARRRGPVPVAELHRLPAVHRARRRRAVNRAVAPPRVRRRGADRGGRRTDPRRPAREPQQPDRRPPLRTADLLTARRGGSRELSRRDRRGVPRVRRPAPTSRTRSSCSATVPTSPCCAPCRRRTASPGCASASSSATPPSSTR